MSLIDDDGWLKTAQRIDSSNYDARPQDTIIDLLVIHSISLPPGEYGGPWINALFTNTLPKAVHPYFDNLLALRVSAHLLIRRDGALIQYVAFKQRAWHAGVSVWQGRQRCNDYSIGIELEGTDNHPYADIQYQQLTTVINLIRINYAKINLDHIVGHSDIAPGRKTDPGASFDWKRLRQLLSN